MNKDSVFFGSEGLTSTSANYIANIAKELTRNLESDIQNIRFVHEEMSVIGSTVQHTLCLGCEEEDVRNIENKLERIIRMKSLIAWIREGLKEKDRLNDEVAKMKAEDVCKLLGLEVPERPEKQKDLTEAEYMASLSEDQRSRIYSLQTRAAAYGKLVHENGSFTKARKELYASRKAPSTVEEFNSGSYRTNQTIVVHSREAAVDASMVDEIYFRLQNIQREAQAELNSQLHKVSEAVRLENLKRHEAHRHSLEMFMRQKGILNAQVEEWREKELHRISKLKLVIPDSLREIYDEVNSTGKQ